MIPIMGALVVTWIKDSASSKSRLPDGVQSHFGFRGRRMARLYESSYVLKLMIIGTLSSSPFTADVFVIDELNAPLLPLAALCFAC